MAGDLSDLFNTVQNLVQAVNGITQAVATMRGNITSATVTADTLVCTGKGRLISVSVLVAGSAGGFIHNAPSVAAAAASNALVETTHPDSTGVINAGQAFTAGLVIAPGTGQSLNVTYFQ